MKIAHKLCKKAVFILSLVIIFFILGEIIVRIFGLAPDFPYQKSKKPDLIYEYIPNFKGKMWGIEFKTNSSGFRDYEYPIQKDKGYFRVIVLGDSITVGEGIALKDSYTKQLEKKLNLVPPLIGYKHFEVINMGICAYNTVREAALFKQRGMAFHPNLVIIGYCLDDAVPSIEETIWELGLNKGWIKTLMIAKDIMFVFKDSHLMHFLRQRFINLIYVCFESKRVANMGSLANLLYSESERYWPDTKKALRELSQNANRENIKVLLVIFPRFESLNENYAYKRIHRLVRNTAEEYGIFVLDLFDAFSGLDPATLRLSDKEWDWWHPNETGNQIAADEIYKFLSAPKRQLFGEMHQ